jgi:hypothetical protein
MLITNPILLNVIRLLVFLFFIAGPFGFTKSLNKMLDSDTLKNAAPWILLLAASVASIIYTTCAIAEFIITHIRLA